MIWMVCVFALFLSSCGQKPQETHYKEIVLQAPVANTPGMPQAPGPNPGDASAPGPMPADPHAGLDLSSAPAGMMDGPANNMFTWTTPQGWSQEPAQGMRLATFHLLADTRAIDCSLVSLGGMAGGLEANLRRWMGQIGVQATADELSGLIAAATNTGIKTGQQGKVFDFTTIQTKAAPDDKSMIVVMVNLDEATLFVKMTGTVATVEKNKDDFFKLVGSIEYHAPSTGPSAVAAALPDVTANAAADPHAGLDMTRMEGLISQPTSQNLLSWTAPQAWKEEPGTHMRMATFHAFVDPQAIDCSIIALAGPAGGLEANLDRWMGQLGLEQSDDHLKQLLLSVENLTTKGGLEARVFDFNALQPQGAAGDKSMLVAVIRVEQTTVFVKMTGTIQAIRKHKGDFLKLLGSMVRK